MKFGIVRERLHFFDRHVGAAVRRMMDAASRNGAMREV